MSNVFVFNFTQLGKIDTMILAIIAYLLVTAVMITLCLIKRKRYSVFPRMRIVKNGIIFSSHLTHRLSIGNYKFTIIKDMVYIKTNSKMVILKNVDDVYFYKNFLYFRALGKCRLICDCSKIYKYFNILIKSDYIDVEKIKQTALNEITNNLFEFEKCKNLIKYLKIIKYILKIEIKDNSIKVGANKYNIPFTLIYKLNDRIKKINIEQTF